MLGSSILAQYCFLPATIVEYLSWGIRRSSALPAVREELHRNRSEELGSRTAGISHFQMLQNSLRLELDLELGVIPPGEETLDFLDAIRDGLVNYSPSYAVGVIYGLEDSAVPELSIVAEAINRLAILKGLRQPITYPTVARHRSDHQNRPMNYSLDEFFALHLLDFEVGHQSRLEHAVGEYLGTSISITDFEGGFEQTLRHMDEWWLQLADRSHHLNSAPPRQFGQSL
jgi:uncharacterized protein DUF3865